MFAIPTESVILSEKFQQVGKDLLAFQFTVLFVVWLALFAPMTCQYHGYLMRAMMPIMPLPMSQISGNPMEPLSSLHVANHSMPLTVTMVMSLLIAALPTNRLELSPADQEFLLLADHNLPLQLALPIPEQPPRTF